MISSDTRGKMLSVFVVVTVLVLAGGAPAAASGASDGAASDDAPQATTTKRPSSSQAPPLVHYVSGHHPDRHRIVAIGDLHGDLENAVRIFQDAQVVDLEHNWASGTDTVIQMGDVVDRGPHAHSIMTWFLQLRDQANAQRGEFITLLGNHELMNLMKDVRFVDAGMVQAFGGWPNWYAHFSDPEKLYGSYMSQLPMAVIRNGTLFVHGGLSPKMLLLHDGSITVLNNKAASVLGGKQFTDPLVGVEGPVWNREVIHEAETGICDKLLRTLSILTDEAKRTAVGSVLGDVNAASRRKNNRLKAEKNLKNVRAAEGDMAMGHPDADAALKNDGGDEDADDRDVVAEAANEVSSASFPAITRMVVGHTIQPNGKMRSFCNSSLLAIDICVSVHGTHVRPPRAPRNGGARHSCALSWTALTRPAPP